MAKKAVLNPTVSDLVSAYGQDLRARGIRWQKLIVFGSHAKGNQTKWSDIDVCVLSNEFSDNRFDNQRLLMHNRSKEFLLIEPHPFRPEEFDNTWDPLANEVRSYGIEVTD